MTERSEAYEVARRMVDQAAAILEAAGFIADQSSLGDARYFTRAGSAARIRVATYAHGHPDQVELTFDRARCLTGWYLTGDEVAAEVDRVLGEYAALAADLTDQEDDAR